ncbi:MAG: class I SAM-dependent methyltransferase [Candidatus Omnitrophica bacterium]|nr:class I SAM-dependent methyltransferase [Candidatus Omnitrophota bacterium]
MRDCEIERIDKLENFYWWFIARRELAISLLRKYIKKLNLRILDVGCGTGMFMKELVRFGKVVGVDKSYYSIQLCHKKGFNSVYQEDISNMHFPSETFDLVTALDVLEHIEDDERAISEIFRVLKNNGIFLLTVPANNSLWSYHDIALNHKRRYTFSELKDKLISIGFEVKRISYCIFFLFLPIFIFRMFQRYFLHIHHTTLITFPKLINFLLLLTLRLENTLLKKGIDFPFGVSLVCVARK